MNMKLVLCILSSIILGSLAQRKPPNYSQDDMPITSFSCRDKIIGGYYADPETDCQMFHVCAKVAGGVQDFRFLCPNNTSFDQENQICDDWYNIDCESHLLFNDNFDLYRLGSEREISSKAAKATPIPLGPTSVKPIIPSFNRQKPFQGSNAIDEEDNFLRADTGDRRLNNDLLRGSSSSNFYSNRNGKDDYLDNEPAVSVKQQDISKGSNDFEKKKNKAVRKLLTGKRPIPNAPNAINNEPVVEYTTAKYQNLYRKQTNAYTQAQSTTAAQTSTTAAPVETTTQYVRPKNSNLRFRGNINYNGQSTGGITATPEATQPTVDYYKKTSSKPTYNKNTYYNANQQQQNYNANQQQQNYNSNQQQQNYNANQQQNYNANQQQNYNANQQQNYNVNQQQNYNANQQQNYNVNQQQNYNTNQQTYNQQQKQYTTNQQQQTYSTTQQQQTYNANQQQAYNANQQKQAYTTPQQLATNTNQQVNYNANAQTQAASNSNQQIYNANPQAAQAYIANQEIYKTNQQYNTNQQNLINGINQQAYNVNNLQNTNTPQQVYTASTSSQQYNNGPTQVPLDYFKKTSVKQAATNKQTTATGQTQSYTPTSQKQTTQNYNEYYRTSTVTPTTNFNYNEYYRTSTIAPTTSTFNYNEYYKTSTNPQNTQFDYNEFYRTSTVAPNSNVNDYYKTSTNAPTSTTFNYNEYYRTSAAALPSSTANYYDPYNSYKEKFLANAAYEEDVQDEFLKTAPSSNLRPSDINAFSRNYVKPVSFNASLTAKLSYNTKGETTVKPITVKTAAPTQNYYSANKNVQSSQQVQQAISQQKSVEPKKEITAAPKVQQSVQPQTTKQPTLTLEEYKKILEKPSDYDYAYYDGGASELSKEYDGIEKIPEEFSKTKNIKKA